MIQAAKDFLGRFQFGYDAITSDSRRRAPTTRVKSEDLILKDKNRDTLSATTQDIQRNFAVAAWAIRQHLNYVSAFTFQARTGNSKVDDAIESFMSDWGSRHYCDVRRQHPFRRMIRLAEARRVVDGDFFFLKIGGTGPNRGKLQAIESDRIASPRRVPKDASFKSDDFVNGVLLSESGEPLRYAINDRDRRTGQLEFNRLVPARNLFTHGFYERFDQVRGISPIASAINSFQDLYEGVDYALAKIKVSQLFGLVFYRDAVEPFDGTEATTDEDGDGTNDSGYEVNFGDGPQVLDLDPGDKADFLHNPTPASETTDFLKFIVHVSLKALDIPYSFFDESFTNFYGSRGGLIQYLKGCRSKIADLQELLDEITSWRLGLAIADGTIEIPKRMDFRHIKWEWVPDGVPWWDPAKDVAGHGMAIAAGLDNPQRVCRQSGTDFYENIDLIAQANEYARAKGVVLVNPGAATAQSQAERNQQEPTDGE